MTGCETHKNPAWSGLPLRTRFYMQTPDRHLGAARCWLWAGGVSSTGYPTIRVDGKTRRASRVALFLFSRFHLDDPRLVLHRCSNRRCVNPSHLYVGTQKQNMADALADGSRAKGERNGSAKYTAKNVSTALVMYRNGARVVDISRQMAVNYKTVESWVHRRIWRHVS